MCSIKKDCCKYANVTICGYCVACYEKQNTPTDNRTLNERFLDVGIVTIREKNYVYLEYKGKRINRPMACNAEKTVLDEFGVIV